VVLPASAYGEKSGTTTNIEGRVTTVSRKITPHGTSRPDWMLATSLSRLLGTDLGFTSVDDVTTAIAETVSTYAGVTPAALASARDGVLAAVPTGIDPLDAVAAPLPDRNSYDFRLVVSRKLYDQGTGVAHSPSLAPLVTESVAHVHPLDIERAGVRAGSDAKVSSATSSVVMRIEPDPTVLRGTVWVPFNQPGPNVGELVDCDAPVVDVRIENL